MVNIISILKEFDGIIGAILGSSTTLIITDILRSKGKLKTYLVEWYGKYKTLKDAHIFAGNKNDSDFYSYNFSYILQVYNKSDIPKIMRDFKVVFYKEKLEILSLIPNDENTREYTGYRYSVDKIQVVNINSKEIQVLKQSGYVGLEQLSLIEGASKICLTYYDEKDRKRTVPLYKGIISTANYVSKY